MRFPGARRLAILVGALALGLATHAQERDGTIARLVEMHGNVLVSRDSGLASGSDRLRVMPGTRVITTAQSDVVVEYDDGCRVKLKENQRFEVERGKPCALLLAQDILATPNYAIAWYVPFGAAAAAAVILGPGGGSSPSGPAVGGSGGEIPISPN